MTNKKHYLWLLGLFIASAVMLSLAQAPMSWWALAWVGYVPFIFASLHTKLTAENAENAEKKRELKKKTFLFYVIAFIVGAGFWLGNIYWLSFVTVAGWIAFCLYTALLWPILAAAIRWCYSKKIPLVIAFPVLIVGIEQCQGLFLGGFYWLYLGHTQYPNTAITQIADIFGVAGISFLVAMVNGGIAEVILLISNKFGGVNPALQSVAVPATAKRGNNWGLSLILKRGNNWGLSLISLLIVIAGVAGSLIYGHWRINQTAKCVTEGPVVAAVQTNVPQSVKQSFEAEGQIFEDLMKDSNECIESEPKPELIVWPETMVQAILEPQVLRMLDETHQYKRFDKKIKDEASKGVYLLVGGYGGTPRIEENWDIRMAEKFNAAFLYQPDGNISPERYYKIHLVPFGEYLPFKNIPVIHNLFVKMSPYDFDYTLDPGKEYTVFDMNCDNKIYKFSTMICYEDAVPYIVRRFILDEEGKKRVNWLVNISNDGWFAGFNDDKVRTSTELAQHTIVCSFRAIENRTAVVRSVNTGISCVIDTSGRIRNTEEAGSLPAKAFERQGISGWFSDRMPIDSRITFFSKHGQWLDFSCQMCLGGIIMIMVYERFRQKSKIKN